MEAQISKLWPGLDERLSRGAVAGIVAGLIFLVANMACCAECEISRSVVSDSESLCT